MYSLPTVHPKRHCRKITNIRSPKKKSLMLDKLSCIVNYFELSSCLRLLFPAPRQTSQSFVDTAVCSIGLSSAPWPLCALFRPGIRNLETPDGAGDESFSWVSVNLEKKPRLRGCCCFWSSSPTSSKPSSAVGSCSRLRLIADLGIREKRAESRLWRLGISYAVTGDRAEISYK